MKYIVSSDSRSWMSALNNNNQDRNNSISKKTSYQISTARTISVITTVIARAIFGCIKGYFAGAPPLRSASQTVLIGGLAAAAAFIIARVIS